jgi:hypothetical protein
MPPSPMIGEASIRKKLARDRHPILPVRFVAGGYIDTSRMIGASQ